MTRFIPLFSGLAFAIGVGWLFTMDLSHTWDGPGHWVQLVIFSEIGKEFLGEKYVMDWFGGYPAFRYYPGFFYFVGSIPIWLGIHPDTSLKLVVLGSAITVVTGYFYWIRYYYPRDSIMPWASLFLYSGFLGIYKMGVGITGILGGNYPHLMGIGFSFWCIGFLVRRKYIHSSIFLAVLGFTHYMGFIFTVLIIVTILGFRKKDVRMCYLGVPLVLGILSFYGILFHGSESSAEVQFAYFPFWETILGGFQEETFLEKLLFHSWKFVPCLVFVGFMNLILRKRYRSPSIHGFMVSSIVFLFLIQDISMGRMFPDIKIHLYRSWDLFYAIVCFLGIYGFRKIPRSYSYAILILTVVFFLFSMERIYSLERYLNHPPQANLIHRHAGNRAYIETTASGDWELRPHGSLIHFKNKNVPIDNGLMVESSWTPYVHRIYLPIEQKNDFQWGFTSPRFNGDLPPVDEKLALVFLELRGIDTIIGKTESFQEQFASIIRKLDERIHQSDENERMTSPYVPLAIGDEWKRDHIKSVSEFFQKSFLLLNARELGSGSYVVLDISNKEELNEKDCEWRNIPVSYYPDLVIPGKKPGTSYYRTHANTIYACMTDNTDLSKIAMNPLIAHLKFLVYIGFTGVFLYYFSIFLKNQVSRRKL